jgi:hypothetical protein
VKVADKTGMVNLSLWNEPGKVLQSGKHLLISLNKNNLQAFCTYLL